jgi:hypothetical protein
MRSKMLISTVVIAAAVAAPVADAHTLSKSDAKREAAKAGVALSRSIGGLPATVFDCTRQSKHAFTCRIGAVSFDGSVCTSMVKVAYRRHSSETPTRRVVEGPDCEPPELLDPIDLGPIDFGPIDVL